MMLNETWYEDPDGKGGYYYTDKADTLHDNRQGKVHVSYRTARTSRFFKTAATDATSPTYKGDFARFSYEHKIGFYFQSDKAFAKWFGEESHYDLDHFFYIDNFRGNENEFDGSKSVAFQLRVSNHPVVHEQWEKTHSSRQDIRAEFCFNFILNPDGRRHESPRDAIENAVTSIDCDISDYYRGMEPERVAFIDKFVNSVVKGEQPHITYDDVLYMGGAKSEKPISIKGWESPYIRRSGKNQHWKENFGERKNLYQHRKNYKFLDDENDDLPSQISSEISLDDVLDGGAESTGDKFEYQGRVYMFDAEHFLAYPEKVRGKGKAKTTYFDMSSPTKIIENKIRIDKNDLVEMVTRVLKSLIC